MIRDLTIVIVSSLPILAFLSGTVSCAFIESNVIRQKQYSQQPTLTSLQMGFPQFPQLPEISKLPQIPVSSWFPQQEQKKKPVRKKRNTIAKIETIQGMDSFLDFIAEDERLCIVKFRASWCKSCQKFDVQFRHFANTVADKVDPSTSDTFSKGEVRLGDVEIMANKQLCKALGIKTLPYIHMYKGSKGRVCDFVVSPKTFQLLIDKTKEHLKDEEETFQKTLEAGSKMVKEHLEMVEDYSAQNMTRAGA